MYVLYVTPESVTTQLCCFTVCRAWQSPLFLGNIFPLKYIHFSPFTPAASWRDREKRKVAVFSKAFWFQDLSMCGFQCVSLTPTDRLKNHSLSTWELLQLWFYFNGNSKIWSFLFFSDPESRPIVTGQFSQESQAETLLPASSITAQFTVFIPVHLDFIIQTFGTGGHFRWALLMTGL